MATDVAALLRAHRRQVLTFAVIGLLLGQLALLLCLSSSQESPVSDEATYIGAAAAYDKYGDLDMNIEHPPLAKLIAGLPFRFTGIDAPKPNVYLTLHQRQYGWHVIYVSNDAAHVVWLARIPEIVLTVGFGLVVFFFARDVWGGHAGLAALALYALMPSVLAQGGVATNDMLLAQATVLCLWLLWRARARPRVYLPLAAIALGLALATKATAFGLLPLVAALTGYIGYRQLDGSRRRRLLAGAGVAGGVLAVAIGVVWCVYLAADPHLRVGSPHALAEQVHGIRRTLVDLLPLPQAYKVGLLIQMSLETEKYPVAILGHSFDDGTRLFLPAALLIKTPIPVLVLGAAGAVRAVRRRSHAVLGFVVLPTVWLLVSTIALTKRPYGSRYILSVMVMLCVLGGAMVVRDATSAERRWRLQRTIAVALVAATAVGSYLTYPYYFTYSNAAFGGSTQTTHTFPNDADTDQDLRRVADYLHRHHINGPIYWLEHGGVPSAYGMHDTVTPQAPDVIQGLTVVFGSQLDLADRKRLAELRPLAVIGNDVFVYDLPVRVGTVPPAENARAGKRDVR